MLLAPATPVGLRFVHVVVRTQDSRPLFGQAVESSQRSRHGLHRRVDARLSGPGEPRLDEQRQRLLRTRRHEIHPRRCGQYRIRNGRPDHLQDPAGQRLDELELVEAGPKVAELGSSEQQAIDTDPDGDAHRPLPAFVEAPDVPVAGQRLVDVCGYLTDQTELVPTPDTARRRVVIGVGDDLDLRGTDDQRGAGQVVPRGIRTKPVQQCTLIDPDRAPLRHPGSVRGKRTPAG
ncbi:hypothetical protein ACIBI8_27815 [Streptomyces sp. NPDC050529]|uniref:hypothetical protein n=1 Tax=Streptomyces sp. NPDC050529 TaxID=3365624 RepID=UPI0037B9C9AE